MSSHVRVASSAEAASKSSIHRRVLSAPFGNPGQVQADKPRRGLFAAGLHAVQRSFSASANARSRFPAPLTKADVDRMAREDDDKPSSRPSFPPPPTLADIRRMEPDMSPASMRRRASECEAPITFRVVVEEKSPEKAAQAAKPLGPVGSGRPALKEAPAPKAVAVATPSPAEAKRQHRKALQAISEWVVDYMYGMVRDGRLVNPSAPSGLPYSRSQTVYRISNILQSSLVPLPVPFLALWYIARLSTTLKYPAGAKADASQRFAEALCGGGLLSTGELIVRMFVSGLALADWWLDDNTFAVKTWRELSFIPSKTIHQMEIAAVTALDHRLRVPPSAWVQYLENLKAYTAAIFKMADEPFPPEILVGRALNTVLDSFRDGQTVDEPHFIGRPVVVAVKAAPAADLKRKREPDCEPATVQPLASCNSVRCDGAPLRKKRVPVPSEWATEHDPVVCKPRKAVGLAIGAERAMDTIKEESCVAFKGGKVPFLPPGFQPLRLWNGPDSKASLPSYERLYAPEQMRCVTVGESS